MQNMNTLRNTLAALHPDMTTVSCKFRGKTSDNTPYVYKITRALADTLEPGDFVVVHTKYAHSIVEVLEVHDTSEIDLEANFLYQWAYQKLDTAENDRLNAVEAEFAAVLDKRQKDNARAALADTLGIDMSTVSGIKLVE